MGGELYHHGIKGQRWGVQRYLNKRNAANKVKEKEATIHNIKKSASKLKTSKNGYQYTQVDYIDVAKSTGLLSGKIKYKKQSVVHIVDGNGKVRMSALDDFAIGSGKKYCDDNINLSKYYRNPKSVTIEYGHYK